MSSITHTLIAADMESSDQEGFATYSATIAHNASDGANTLQVTLGAGKPAYAIAQLSLHCINVATKPTVDLDVMGPQLSARKKGTAKFVSSYIGPDTFGFYEDDSWGSSWNTPFPFSLNEGDVLQFQFPQTDSNGTPTADVVFTTTVLSPSEN